MSLIVVVAIATVYYLHYQAEKKRIAKQSSRIDKNNPDRSACLELLGFSPDTGDSQYFEKTLARKRKCRWFGGIDWSVVLEQAKKLLASGKTIPEVKELLCSENAKARRMLLG